MINLANSDQLKSHLQRFGITSKKSLGQHFLVDEKVLDRIVEAAELTPEDHVVEVGAGPGVLSQRLAPRVKELTALEIDAVMIPPWRQLMKDQKNAHVQCQDVLQFVPENRPYKVVANIPYYITSPILKHFLRHQQVRRPQLVVLLIQREVAERIVDAKQPTLLSWELRVFGKAEIICAVPPRSFMPPPKVDSAVLRLTVYDKPLLEEQYFDAFFKMLSLAYKQPRKTLLNNFLAAGKWDKAVIEAGFDKSKAPLTYRPHQLSWEQWKSLFAIFSKDF